MTKAIFKEVWGECEKGNIDKPTAHRMLGRYFGYPECCIEAFIADFFEEDNIHGEVHDRFYCWDCLALEGVAE